MLGDPNSSNHEYAADYPYQPQPAALLDSGPTLSIDFRINTDSRPFPWLAVVLGGYFAVSDVAVMPLTCVFQQSDWGAIWVYISLGVILAQSGLLSAGLVFAPGRYWKRLFVFWTAAAVFCILWSIGFLIMSSLRPWQKVTFSGIRFGVLALPLAGLAIQSPLWVFRLYGGWRFILDDGEKPEPPLTIRNFLVGTAIVALSMTLARLAVEAKYMNDDYWAGWGIFFGIAALMRVASVVPALVLMFRCDWRLGLIALTHYSAIATISVLAIASCFDAGPFSSFAIWEAIGFVAVFVSFATFLGLGLKAVRDAGFRLATRKSRGAGAVDLRK